MADPNALRAKMFQGQKDDLERNARGQSQEAEGAINRRFAALGQQGSGAAIGANIKAQESVQAGANQARNAIQTNETQAQIAAEEAQAGRDFASSQADKDMTFKKGMFDVEQGNKLKELDLADQQFALDKDTNAFNRALAQYEMDQTAEGKKGKFEQLFGTSGFTTGADSVLDPLGFGRGGGGK